MHNYKHPTPQTKRFPKSSDAHRKQKPPEQNPQRRAVRFDEAPDDSGGFMSLLLARIAWEELNDLKQRKHGAGRPLYVLSRAQLLAALLFHFTVSWTGTFAEHLFCLFGIQM